MIRLFHVSDVHFGCEDTAAVAWFGRVVAAEVPDAIVMTGDLTMRARSSEYEAGLAWLRGLGRPVTVEVGNHDLPYFNPLRRLFRPYGRYRRVEREVERPLDLPGVAIVPLRTTARFQWRFNWSKGNVSRRQLAKTLRLMGEVPEGRLIFVAAHHPLIEPHTRATAQTHHGAKAFARLAAAGADAVLSGHVHDPFDIAQPTDGGEVRLIGAGTLSRRTRDLPPSFNEIRILEGRIEVIVRTFDPVPARVLPVEVPAAR